VLAAGCRPAAVVVGAWRVEAERRPAWLRAATRFCLSRARSTDESRGGRARQADESMGLSIFGLGFFVACQNQLGAVWTLGYRRGGT
jgi:hypothetical protein